MPLNTTPVLKESESEGRTFTLLKGESGYVMFDIHNGGTWTVQMRSPAGIWVDTLVTFTDVGVKAVEVIDRAQYRVAGGTVGARAYAGDTGL